MILPLTPRCPPTAPTIHYMWLDSDSRQPTTRVSSKQTKKISVQTQNKICFDYVSLCLFILHTSMLTGLWHNKGMIDKS